MSLLDLVQWPAMAVTVAVAAAWFVASGKQPRRRSGVWLFLLSNLLWVRWDIYTWAWGLVSLQVRLAGMNVRGEKKNSANRDAAG